MSKQELQKSIEALRYEVDSLGSGDAATQKRLHKVIADLEEQMDDVHDEDVRNSMSTGIRRLIQQFEEEHPSITEALNRVMTTLSNMGI